VNDDGLGDMGDIDDDEALFRELKQLLDSGKITQQEYDDAMSGGLDDSSVTEEATATTAERTTDTAAAASPPKRVQQPQQAACTPLQPALSDSTGAAAEASRCLLMSPETAGLLGEMKALLAAGNVTCCCEALLLHLYSLLACLPRATHYFRQHNQGGV
jgi:hypothetical protein